jgi:hypothetical protein
MVMTTLSTTVDADNAGRVDLVVRELGNYAGAIMNFELVESSVQYSKHLVRKHFERRQRCGFANDHDVRIWKTPCGESSSAGTVISPVGNPLSSS